MKFSLDESATILERYEADRIRNRVSAKEAAEKVLKAWFKADRSRTTYDGRIAVSIDTKTDLDQAAAKAFFGDELHKFQREIEVVRLSLVPKEIQRP